MTETRCLRPIEIGQEAGIRTRTVRFTGGDAAVTPQSWREFTIYDLRFTRRTQVWKPPPVRARLVNRKSQIVNESGALTWICTTNLRLRRAACRTDYTLRAVQFTIYDLRVRREIGAGFGVEVDA